MGRKKLLTKKQNMTLTVSDRSRMILRYLSSHYDRSISQLVEEFAESRLSLLQKEQHCAYVVRDQELIQISMDLPSARSGVHVLDVDVPELDPGPPAAC